MTYHPIDKPTEPGWYWFIYSNGYRILEVQNRNGRLGVVQPELGFVDCHAFGQWYGPAIQPPQSAHDTRQIALPGAVIPELPTTKEEPPETLP